jgi:hypothetical protein
MDQLAGPVDLSQVQVAALPGLFACIQDGDCAPGERSASCIELYTLLLGAHGGPNAIQTTLRLGIVDSCATQAALDVAQYVVKGTCPASCTSVAQLVALSCARMACHIAIFEQWGSKDHSAEKHQYFDAMYEALPKLGGHIEALMDGVLATNPFRMVRPGRLPHGARASQPCMTAAPCINRSQRCGPGRRKSSAG